MDTVIERNVEPMTGMCGHCDTKKCGTDDRDMWALVTQKNVDTDDGK